MTLTKKCSKCSEVKLINKFHKAKSCKLGVRPECIECHRKENKNRRRTKEGHIKNMYGNQVGRSKRLDFEKPSYTKNELIDWCLSQDKFHIIYDKFVKSNYDKWEAPSCDRLDDYKPYTLDNLQILSWKKNFYKYQTDRIKGINNKQGKRVGQFTKDGKLIAEFHSGRYACRVTNNNQGNVSSCLNGRAKSAGGYIWKFL